MDIAMGQRGMYLSVRTQFPLNNVFLAKKTVQMLKHAGMFESQPSMIPSFNSSTNTELQWRSWLHRESQNRYVICAASRLYPLNSRMHDADLPR